MQRYGAWCTTTGVVRSVLTPALEDVVRQEITLAEADLHVPDEKPGKRRRGVKTDPDCSANEATKPVIHTREQLLSVQCDNSSLHCTVLLSGDMISQIKPGMKIEVTGEASIFGE